jgi:sialic acid synthase SpsE
MTYIIGEIGQNHNGSVDIAKTLIDLASSEIIDNFNGKKLKGINAIKFTKRDLNDELSNESMYKIYDSPNSFGRTYGEHRKFLELSNEDHLELYNYTKEKKLDFVETLCSIGCLDLLRLFKPDFLKVASRDLKNLPLLEVMAQTKIPIILSTGMGGKIEIENALEIVTRYHENISILHCVSQYPTEYENVNLKTITYLKNTYPKYNIGFSDHTIGIVVPTCAVAMGAKIIEKHITIDRNMKGTDQKGSLALEGLKRMIRDIRNIEESLGKEDMFISNAVSDSKIKLERSIASNKNLKKGHIISENDLKLLSPGDGYSWNEKSNVIGKKLLKDIAINDIIYNEFLA